MPGAVPRIASKPCFCWHQVTLLGWGKGGDAPNNTGRRRGPLNRRSLGTRSCGIPCARVCAVAAAWGASGVRRGGAALVFGGGRSCSV